MSTKKSTAIKICGITKTKQAIEIVNLGAHAIGLVAVESSPRFVNEKKRREIFKELEIIHPKIFRVLVTSNMGKGEIKKNLTGEGTPNVIQLHGNETPNDCQHLKGIHPLINIWKAVQVRDIRDIERAHSYEESVDALLLDAWKEGALGGTGERIPIELIIKERFNVSWWIAGGISPDSITEILKLVSPTGIDASSKLELSPGIKDLEKVIRLINLIKLINNKST